jgi:hypothetical protein
MPGATFPVADRRGRPEFVGDDNIAWRVIRLFEQGQQPNAADPPLRSDLFGFLRSTGIDAVLVGPMAHEDRVVAFFTILLGRPPIAEGGISRWTSVLATMPAS